MFKGESNGDKYVVIKYILLAFTLWNYKNIKKIAIRLDLRFKDPKLIINIYKMYFNFKEIFKSYLASFIRQLWNELDKKKN